MGRFLGVDFGKRHTGLAISDTTGLIAVPLDEVISEADPRRLAERIVELCRERDIETVVVGLPLNMDGSEGPAARAVREVVEHIRALTAVNVVVWDERLSTKQVESAARGRTRKIRPHMDSLAAQVILQSFLDARARGTDSQDENPA
ncbi:MAG: Holliday junction resolvase RuvX [Verrucomicrobia bacterium]|nr:MAG: Holliday junction resolvase RuvX [Verrucomicrobiota bacterium]